MEDEQRSVEDWLNYFRSVPVKHWDFRILSYNGLELLFSLMVFPDSQPSHLAPRSRRVWGDSHTICINWCKWEFMLNMQSLCCSSRVGFGLHWVESWEVLTNYLFQHLWPHKNIIQCLPKHCLHAEYDISKCMRIINLVKCRSSYWKTEKETVQPEL